MYDSSIHWCDSTCNGQMGCDGCELWTPEVKICYAGHLIDDRYAGMKGFPESFDKPELYPERIREYARLPDLRGKVRPKKPWLPRELPRLIFFCDMGDPFTESLPEDWLAPYLKQMEDCPHIWILLTKRPKRMAKFFKQHTVPKNFWLLTSVTKKESLTRIPDLLTIENASVLGVSLEPQWEQVSLKPYLHRLGWVIQGGQSRQKDAPIHDFHLEWAREVRDECREAGVPYFLKQLGTRAFESGKQLSLRDAAHGGNWEEWAEDLRVRGFPAAPALLHKPEGFGFLGLL